MMQLALFAGRRSTDRVFLLLQTVLCARHLPNYLGSSSIFAATLIDRALRSQGLTRPEERVPHTGAHHQPPHWLISGFFFRSLSFAQ
jgi:hypothetical protein